MMAQTGSRCGSWIVSTPETALRLARDPVDVGCCRAPEGDASTERIGRCRATPHSAEIPDGAARPDELRPRAVRRAARQRRGRRRARSPTRACSRSRRRPRGAMRRHGATRDVHNRVAQRLLADAATPVLDVGCGEGELACHLPRRAWVGADASPTMLAGAPEPHVHADATALPFKDGSFGGVALLYVLYHLPDPRPALRRGSPRAAPRRHARRRRAQPPRLSRTRPPREESPAYVRRGNGCTTHRGTLRRGRRRRLGTSRS